MSEVAPVSKIAVKIEVLHNLGIRAAVIEGASPSTYGD